MQMNPNSKISTVGLHGTTASPTSHNSPSFVQPPSSASTFSAGPIASGTNNIVPSYALVDEQKQVSGFKGLSIAKTTQVVPSSTQNYQVGRTASFSGQSRIAKAPIVASTLNSSVSYLVKSTSSIGASPVVNFTKETSKFSIGNFEIIKTLGTGSFGRVHLVKNKLNGQFMALKALAKESIVRQKQVQHTINEKHLLSQVNCPFIVNQLGSFQDSGHVFFVMEYVPGGELFSLIRKYRCLPPTVAKFYAAQVVLALEYLHSRNIVYRDLKPENLLLDSQGNIKLTDFGFAKHVPDVTYTLCGTPDYLAPEVIQSKAYGKAVDWWSLGVLIYEMLVGHPPFYDESPLKLYEKILACKLRFPANMDPLARDLINCLLERDLTKRYGNLKGGVADIKGHPWFQKVDWNLLWNKKVTTPYVPPIKHAGDSQMFDNYDENYKTYTEYDGQADGYGSLFNGF